MRYLFSFFLLFAITAVSAQEYFGEKIDQEGAVSYDEFMKQAKDADSLHVKVIATAQEICQMKGCWMTITSENADESTMVRFKDYGFFVPKDISGQQVVIEGVAQTQFTSVDELKHYAEDAGKSAEEIAKITEGKHEIAFLASGVIVLD